MKSLSAMKAELAALQEELAEVESAAAFEAELRSLPQAELDRVNNLLRRKFARAQAMFK